MITIMKSLSDYVRIKTCVLTAALFLLTLPALDGAAQPFVRQLEREDKPTLIMSCGRWAQLYMVVAEHGLAKTILWLQMPQSNSRPSDVEYVTSDIIPLLESNAVSSSYAGAWGICAGNQI